MGLEEKIPDSIILTTLDKMVNWARKRSTWPLGFGLACCAIEMISTMMPHFDLSRYGMEVMRPSPRQADLMIVAGRVSMKMAPVIKTLYDQMPNPKWVLSMGACAAAYLTTMRFSRALTEFSLSTYTFLVVRPVPNNSWTGFSSCRKKSRKSL
jgi:NADH-quinone oxidoreductase B subunit